MLEFVRVAWLFDQVETVGAVRSIMVAAATGLAGPMLPAASVPAFCASVAVAVTPSLHPLRSKS